MSDVLNSQRTQLSTLILYVEFQLFYMILLLCNQMFNLFQASSVNFSLLLLAANVKITSVYVFLNFYMYTYM